MTGFYRDFWRLNSAVCWGRLKSTNMSLTFVRLAR